MSEPHQDVLQDLWQLTHPTASYVTRAAAGGLLLGTGIIDKNPVAIVVAALFLSFLSDVLAIAFGFWSRDMRLVLRGIRAVMISSVLAFSGGAVAEWFSGNPISYTAFKGPLAGLAISAAIGVTAGLSNADDTGRRYLVGVAAAVQLAIIAAWVGAALVRRHDTADGIPLIRCFGFWAHRPLARSAAFRNCYASVTIFGLPSKSFPACTAETAQLAQPE